MYPGYVAFGAEAFRYKPELELVNTERALGYIDKWNKDHPDRCITWVNECESCPGTSRFWDDVTADFYNRIGYCGPDYPPFAPWYDPANADTLEFLGVIGLEVQGAEDGMQTATVRQSIKGGGVVGKSIMRPHEMVVRAIMVAASEPGLNVGYEWMRLAVVGMDGGWGYCRGDYMWFLDACPEAAAESDWPNCVTPPRTVANPENVLVPYVRHFRETRVIGGPTILRQQEMPSGGWMAEIEVVVVAPDDAKYGEPYTLWDSTRALATPTGHTDPSPPPPPPPPDTVAGRLGVSTVTVAPAVTLPDVWQRSEQQLPAHPEKLSFSRYSYSISVDAAFDDVRIELVDRVSRQTIEGIELPFLIPGQDVHVDAAKRTVTVDGQPISGYVRNYDGFPAPRWAEHPHHPDGVDLIVDWTGTNTAAQIHVRVDAVDTGAA